MRQQYEQNFDSNSWLKALFDLSLIPKFICCFRSSPESWSSKHMRYLPSMRSGWLEIISLIFFRLSFIRPPYENISPVFCAFLFSFSPICLSSLLNSSFSPSKWDVIVSKAIKKTKQFFAIVRRPKNKSISSDFVWGSYQMNEKCLLSQPISIQKFCPLCYEARNIDKQQPTEPA